MRHSTKTIRKAAAATAALALALTLAGCGSVSGDSTSSGGGTADKSITLGIIPSWTDGLSTAYLWKDVLQQKGYDVTIKKLSDAAPLYAGIAKGDIDVYPSAWPEVTQKAYMKQYGDDIEDVGTYYDNAKLTLSVPQYTNIDSIADLKGKASKFDGKITGIEPGAGLTKTTQGSVMPKYGLDDSYQLVTSSTTAMLTQLKKSVQAHQPIVVTLWKPFWANSKFPVKTLQDPKNALGPSEGLHELARTGFKQDFPKVAAMMHKLTLDDSQYGTLENMVVNKFGHGKEPQAVDAWEKDHQDVLRSLQG